MNEYTDNLVSKIAFVERYIMIDDLYALAQSVHYGNSTIKSETSEDNRTITITIKHK